MARLPMGELEARVLEVLWDSEEWLTPGSVHAVLTRDRELAYTTALTILVRLWKKGLLERRREGRAYAYRPVRAREEHVAARMSELLTSAKDRPAALLHFVEGMSASDRAKLRRLLAGKQR